jgi:ArsR family metal-binding transcriptional regulator
MLVDHYDLEIFTPPCDPGSERYTATVRLAADISAVLPYLNATLQEAEYQPAAPALAWKQGRHFIVFHPAQIAASNFEDRAEAVDEAQRLVALVNDIWERRAEITPDHSAPPPRPLPLAVYRLLPRTNCKQCGEPTCYTFALKLVASQRAVDECPPLLEAGHAESLAALRRMVRT